MKVLHRDVTIEEIHEWLDAQNVDVAYLCTERDLRERMEADDRGKARRTDPKVSKDAAEQIRTSRTKRLLLLEIIREPNRTAREVATAIGNVGEWRRVTSLAQLGLVEVAGERLDSVTKTRARIWKATPLGYRSVGKTPPPTGPPPLPEEPVLAGNPLSTLF